MYICLQVSYRVYVPAGTSLCIWLQADWCVYLPAGHISCICPQADYCVSSCRQDIKYHVSCIMYLSCICLKADYCLSTCRQIIMYAPTGRLSCICLQANYHVSVYRHIILYLPAGRLLCISACRQIIVYIWLQTFSKVGLKFAGRWNLRSKTYHLLCKFLSHSICFM